MVKTIIKKMSRLFWLILDGNDTIVLFFFLFESIWFCLNILTRIAVSVSPNLTSTPRL